MEIEHSLAYEELLKTHQRDINCLIDDDRNLRKKGLTSILNSLFGKKVATKESLQLFSVNVIKNLLRAVDDPIEKNREITQNIIQKYCEHSKDVDGLTMDREVNLQITSKLCSRINTIPFAEQSEEIRLMIVNNLMALVQNFSQDLLPILGDFAIAIARALQDSYPEVKKSAAALVEECAVHLKNHIGYHGIQISKSLAKNLEHQHSKALTNFLRCEGAGSLYEHVHISYSKAVHDKINEVRKIAYESVAQLLNGFSIANLRSFEADLVLLLLNSLSDEVPEFVELGKQLLEDVGLRRKLLAIEINEKVDGLL